MWIIYIYRYIYIGIYWVFLKIGKMMTPIQNCTRNPSCITPFLHLYHPPNKFCTAAIELI